MLLKILLALIVVMMPNMAMFSIDTGITGLNIANLSLIFAALLIALSNGSNEAIRPVGYLTVPLFFMFVVVIAYCMVSCSKEPEKILTYVVYAKEAIFYPLFYFVFRRSKLDYRSTRFLIIVSMAVSALAALQAVRQGFDYGLGKYNETHRASGPFGHDYRMANLAGAYYAMFIPMFVALALFLKNQPFWRAMAIAGTVLLSVAIMVTYSRQSYLIALVCIALLVARRNLFYALVLAIAMWSLVGFLPNSVTQRVEETRQEDSVGTVKLDESAASRFEIWHGAYQMWSDNPLGVGLGRFKEEIGNYSNSYSSYDAHNFYILLLAETGPFGILALAGIFIGLGRLLLYARRNAFSDEARALSLGFAVTTLAMAMTNLYGSRYFEGTVMAGFWILCGLMERYIALQPARGASPSQQAALRPARSYPLVLKAFPGRAHHSDQREEN